MSSLQPSPAACVLAIDAAAEPVSVALAYRQSVDLRRLPGSEPAAEAALARVAELLDSRALSVNDVDVFAFASGPGAFTGLRVACGLTQGLAFACQRPVIAVGSLRALAFGVRRRARVLAAIDARMGQAYWGVYEDWPPRQLSAPALAAPGELSEQAQRWRPDVIAGNALRVFPEAWLKCPDSVQLPDAAVDAALVAELARLDASEGGGLAARDAAPDYIRNQVARTVAQRRAS